MSTILSVRQCSKCHQNDNEGVKLLSCSKCRSVFYCNVTCQKADWKNHQPNCQKLKKKCIEKTQKKIDDNITKRASHKDSIFTTLDKVYKKAEGKVPVTEIGPLKVTDLHDALDALDVDGSELLQEITSSLDRTVKRAEQANKLEKKLNSLKS